MRQMIPSQWRAKHRSKRDRNIFPPGVKPTQSQWSRCLLWPHSTSTFFTPASFWNPHYIKTCLISVLPSPSAAPRSCTLNEPLWLPLGVVSRQRVERASSELDYVSSYSTNTQYAWLLGPQESPQLSQYVIMSDPISQFSGSVLCSCMRIKWSSGA